MADPTTSLHKLLLRQMARLGIDEQSIPTDLKCWQSFLGSISNAYMESEQERYLVERSIELSSAEFLQLTGKLETAQQIAHLGYWSYEKSNDTLILSNSLYTLFGLQATSSFINKEQFLQLVHEEDRLYFEELIEKVMGGKKRVEQEIRIKNEQGEYGWYNFVGDSTIRNNGEGYKLSGIAMDINQRKKVEQELETSNQQLISTARMAGMADVAISVLHNVGNTLNSANVAIGLIQENMSKSNLGKLTSIAKMLRENQLNITQYLSDDPKGKLIPEYIVALSEVMEKEQKSFSDEVANISRSIKHVKEIVSAQQLVSKVNGVIEKVYLPEIIEDALKIGGELFAKKDIMTNKNFENVGFVKVDKTKLIQILVNIIQNAQDSCIMNNLNYQKKIDLSLKKNDQNVDIIIEDNGVGISSENMKKLFTFGFTTKEKGHGFGLHSSILAAQEIGGDLKGTSKGEGLGATFILSLPLLPPSSSVQ